MKMVTRFLCKALFCLLLHPIAAQNILISYQKSDSLFVCGTDTFFVQVQNTGAAPMLDGTLHLTLPAGVVYLPGTIVGATQVNVTNPQQPVFALPSLAPGATGTVSLLLTATCAAAAALDAGQLFIANIAVQSSVGNASIATTNFALETGLILIESVENPLMSGEKGDTLFRKICVRNTRLGKIGNLHFEDSHKPGIELSIVGATSQTNLPELSVADFDGSFFAAVGNGDHWLDVGETVCFTERIIITDCGTPPFFNTSLLRVGWGCGGEVCRYDSVLVNIEIKESKKVPDLVFEQIWNAPTDHCGNTPAIIGMKINNIGKSEAKDVFVRLRVQDMNQSKAGIGNNSFRVVHNGISTPLAPNLASFNTLDVCGLTVTNDASLVLPLVAAQDSVLLLFDAFTCETSCEQVLPTVQVEYFYRKPCPENGFVSDTLLIVPDGEYTVNGFVGFKAGVCLQNANSYVFNYQAVSKRLVEDDGFWHVTFDMSQGLSFDENCPALLGGAAPDFTTIEPSANGGYTVHLTWALPLPSDSLNMDFCLRYDCDTTMNCLKDFEPADGTVVVYSSDCPIACFLQLSTHTYWTPQLNTPFSCAISDCDSLRMVVNTSCLPIEDDPGAGDTTILDIVFPLPGFNSRFEVYRLNYGFEDGDDDRRADSDALLHPEAPLVRRDRFLAGDTLRVEYCGAVDSGGELVYFARTIWHEVVGSDMITQGNDVFLTQSATNTFCNSNRFRFLRDSIRIRYADGSQVACSLSDLVSINDENFFSVNQVNTWPPAKVDEIATQRFRFYFSLENLHDAGCLPKGTLDLGDSLFVYTDFKIDLNYRPISTNHPDPPLVGFRTALSGGGKVYAYNEQPFKKLQYSGINITRSANQHSIRPCEPSLEPRRFRQTLRIARENMFTHEVRPIARISDYWQTVPDDLEALSVKLEYLVLQDSVARWNNLDLPFQQSPGILSIDFAPAFDEPVDEGFMLRTNIAFKPDCSYDRPDSSRQYITLEYHVPLESNIAVTDSITNQIGFFSNAPDLRFEAPDSILVGNTKAFGFNFVLKNNVVSTAFNSWVAVVSPNGNATNFEVIQVPQNQPVATQNGIFQTGNIGGFGQQGFRLQGLNGSCGPDTLLIIFGWDCAPVAGLEQATCGRDTYWLELRLEKPELELNVLKEPNFIAVCDSSDYFEFEIFNAKTGFAYDPFATVKLPPGIFIVPGSCQVSYPAGSAYQNIPDPTDLSSNLFQWAIDSIVAAIAANGLPGVDKAPLNTLRIRFKTYAECGFVANTQVIYGTRGTEPCGRSTNVLNKPGEPLKISGLNTGLNVVIQFSTVGSGTAFCGGSQSFEVTIVSLGLPTDGDSIYVSLPMGVSYLPGSYLPLDGAPTGPPSIDAQGFRLPFPNAGAGVIKFRFDASFDATAGCVDPTMVVQTRLRSEVFCPTLGAPCTIYAATGQATLSISLQRPELQLGSVNANVNGTEISLNIGINNIGNVPANGATAQIWQDMDGDGTLSAGDVLLQTVENEQVLLPGGSFDLSALLSVQPAMLCDLLFALPAEENCICATQTLRLNNINLTYQRQEYCDIQTVNIGVAEQPGFEYQWLTATGIACPTCSSTQFTPPASTPPGQPVTLVLEEKSGDCMVLHRFEFTFGTPPASIMVNNPAICKGESAILTAQPPGNDYQWSPGSLPSQQQITVSPVATTTYAVTVTFPSTCTQAVATTVFVALPDTTLLPGLITCQGDPVVVLGNTTDVPGLYSNVLQNIAGCDSIIYQRLDVLPRAFRKDNFSFCVGDTLFLLDTAITQSGQVCRTYIAANGCDSLYCVNATAFARPPVTDPDTLVGIIGQPLVLNGPDGYVTYSWWPNVPNCPNCQNITILTDSTFVEYQLLVTDANGCSGLIVYRVLLGPPCDGRRLRIPNAFTPNGDSVNDVFRVVPYEGLEIIGSLTIYDRWGEKVYENQGNVFWDGSIAGKPGPSDVYVYRIDIICDGKPEAIWGDVTLLR